MPGIEGKRHYVLGKDMQEVNTMMLVELYLLVLISFLPFSWTL